MRRLSDVPEDELKRYLAKIRRISKMDDEDALVELDEFIHRIVSEAETDFDDDLDEDRLCFSERSVEKPNIETLEQAKEELVELKKYLEDIAVGWDAKESILFEKSEFAKDWPEDIRGEMKSDIDKIFNQMLSIAKDTETAHTKQRVSWIGKKPIYNISSIKGILSDVLSCEEQLNKNGALDTETQVEIRSIKEKCAYHRADASSRKDGGRC